MPTIDDILAPYDYAIPERLIAKEPAHPRDAAKLLVLDRSTGKTSFSTFAHIDEFLPKDAVLVFNRTKVIPARMRLKKETGGEIEALYLGTEEGALRTMASGKIAEGDALTWEDGHRFTVRKRDGKYAVLEPSFAITDLFSLLDRHGETPLPPYIKESPLTERERRDEYQTVYARDAGSVAAPTAGLHFTPALLERLAESGRTIAYVTLHVNLGTFAPLTEEHLTRKKLHEEYYEIDPATAAMLNDAKQVGRPIIAVGTTSVRTLESACENGVLTNLSGITDIFLTEDDTPRFVDGLITNFHVPKSSLLMLVSAFVGRETLLELYANAIGREYRFFSFGDGMLIL